MGLAYLSSKVKRGNMELANVYKINQSFQAEKGHVWKNINKAKTGRNFRRGDKGRHAHTMALRSVHFLTMYSGLSVSCEVVVVSLWLLSSGNWMKMEKWVQIFSQKSGKNKCLKHKIVGIRKRTPIHIRI